MSTFSRAISSDLSALTDLSAHQLPHKVIKALLTGLISIVALQLCAVSWARDDVHDHSNLPIWSDISYFERNTLSDWHKARKGEPDALLALYIMASGRHSHSDYDRVKGRIDEFISHVEADVKSLVDPWQQGELLNREMHKAFYPEPGRSRTPLGYDEDQSKFMGIFDNNTFNCISSSLLYIVLARHFDKDVTGVVLPSHAFVQLTLENNRHIDVETTSANGFGIHHDEAFYERAASQWFSARGLSPSSFEDYQNRQIVSPATLGVFNMNNQHTRPGRMNYDDRGRLAEISAYLMPEDVNAQLRRLHFYSNEVQEMQSSTDWPSLVQFFNTVLETIKVDGARYPTHEMIHNTLFWLHLVALQSYAHVNDIETTKNLFKVVTELSAKKPDTRSADTMAAMTMATRTIITNQTENERFEEALLFLLFAQEYLNRSSHWPATVAWFYHQWTQYRWQQEDWPGVIDIVDMYLAQPHKAPNNFKATTSLSKAYYNWVVSYVNIDDIPAAQSIVDQCSQKYELKDLCHKARETLKGSRRELSSSK